MPRSVAEIDADIAALRACPPGVQTLSYSDGRSTSFSTAEQKRMALADLMAERAAATASAAGTVRRRQIQFTTSKGL